MQVRALRKNSPKISGVPARFSWHQPLMIRHMARPPRVNPIGRPSKGARPRIVSRVEVPVYDEVRRRATDLGIPVSQYAADVLAQHVGRNDLVRELVCEADQQQEGVLATST